MPAELTELKGTETANTQQKNKVKNLVVFPMILWLLGAAGCEEIIRYYSISNSSNPELFYQRIFYVFLIISFILFICYIRALFSAQRFYNQINISDCSELFKKQRSGLKEAWEAYSKTMIDWKETDSKGNEIISKRTRTNADLYFDGEHWVNYSYTPFPIEALLRIIPGTLIGMGILGTFIGFATGVSALGDVSEKTAEELMNGIGSLTSGLETAFYTSIIGVVMSVIVNFLMFNPLKNACDMICQKICDEIDGKFFISDYDALHKDLDGVSDAIKNQFANGTSDLAQQVGNIVTESVKANINALQVVIDKQIEELNKTIEVAETIPQKIEQSFVNTKEFIQATLDESREKFVAELDSTIGNLEKCIVSFDAVPVKIESAFENSKQFIKSTLDESREKFVAELDLTVGNLEKCIMSFDAVPIKIETAFENSKQFIKSTLDESREKYMAEIDKTVEAINGCIDALNENQEKLRQSNAKFSEQVSNVIDRFSDTSDDISNHFKKTADEFTQNFGQSAKIATDNFKNLSESIAKNFAKIIDQTDVTFEKIQDFAGFYEEANKVTENLKNILSQMQTYNKQTQAGYDSVLNSLTAITNESKEILREFKGLDSTLASTVGTINDNLNAYNNTVANALQNYLGQFADKSSSFANGLNSSVQSLELTSSNLVDLSQDLTKSVQEFSSKNEKFLEELKKLNP